MDLKISGKVALVFGAGGGLGGAIAEALAAEGAHIAVAGRLRARGTRVLDLAWDLSNLDTIDPNFTRIEGELGAVDILINNTGGPPPSKAEGVAAELWTKQFQSMVLSVIKVTDRALPAMRQRKWGRIITSTSYSMPRAGR